MLGVLMMSNVDTISPTSGSSLDRVGPNAQIRAGGILTRTEMKQGPAFVQVSLQDPFPSSAPRDLAARFIP